MDKLKLETNIVSELIKHSEIGHFLINTKMA